MTFDCERTDFITCPKCGHVHHETTDYDSWWDEGEHEGECEHCEATFQISTHVTITFTTALSVGADEPGEVP